MANEEVIAPRDMVQSLIKGLAVIQAFGPDRKSMSMTEVANTIGISKPSARRFLLTLQSAGYVRREGEQFRLLPKVLDLGLAYFSSIDLPEIGERHLEELNMQVKEACSLGIFDGDSVIYIARAQWQRVRSVSVRVGTRIDPATTALGRVLLASLPDDELDAWIDRHKFEVYTEYTVADPKRLRAILDDVREKGWAMCDQEVELGVRTLAAPVHKPGGKVVAGVNVAANYQRVPLDKLIEDVLPQLLDTTARIDRDLAVYGPGLIDY